MKLRFTLMLMLFFGFFSFAYSQTPASVTWPLTSTTTYAPVTSGQVNALDQAFANMKAFDYGGPSSSQRTSIYDKNWPAAQTAQLSNTYMQFAVLPKLGQQLHIDSISLYMTATSTNTMEANIYYSTDSTFATSFPIRYVNSSQNNYVTRDALTLFNVSSVGAVVDPGETFYLRIYPWNENAAITSGKYFCPSTVYIGGYTIALGVNSSVLWPFTTDSSYIVTGSALAQNASFSSTLQLDTMLNVSGHTIGGIKAVSDSWNAESAPVSSIYTQFVVYPKFGGNLIVNDVSLYMGAAGTSSMRAAVYASTDAAFAIFDTLVADTLLVHNSIQKFNVAGISDTLAANEKYYIRIYPYTTTAEADSQLLLIDSVAVNAIVMGNTIDPPTVSTTAISNISTSYAASGGNISTDGGGAVSERGVCLNTTGTPTTADTKITSGTGSGSFVGVPTGLTPNTTYYLRAYAINDAGTAYGNQIVFTTLAAIVAPTLTTNSVTNIMALTAKSGGNITEWGGDTIIARGICWNTTGTPTTADSTTENGTGIGSFPSTMVELTPNTQYYVRAYATSKLGGTGYGNELPFTTQIIKPDTIVVVRKDGGGDYTSIQGAFDSVQNYYTGRWIICVKPDTYKEKLSLAAGKVNVIIVGDSAGNTILTYDDYANIAGGTSNSYSTTIEADDFTAINITFQNTVKNDGSQPNQQAVALRSNGDRQSFYNCNILGYQDTYYAYGGGTFGRIYFNHCILEGSVDYIFGQDIVIFDSCEIRTNRDGGNITAASTAALAKFGLVFTNCTLSVTTPGFNGSSVSSFTLGRPWQNSPQTVFLHCYEPIQLTATAWTTMQVSALLYAEYKCYGPGSDTTSRSDNAQCLGQQLTDSAAALYTISNIFAKTSHPTFGFNWTPSKPVITGLCDWSDVEETVTLPKGYFEIFPNPANTNITVKRSSDNKETMSIFNSIGLKVMEKQLLNATENIDISPLQQGIYFISIQNKTYTLMVK